jgi:hypothetical protein
MKKPCSNCFITAAQPGLEFEDGREANIDSNIWLHHMVLHNVGKQDTTCPMRPQRWMGAGNERQTKRINASGKYGYKVDEGDVFGDILELMNMGTENVTVYLTMKYEWLPADSPAAEGYKPITSLWLDVSGACGLGDKFAWKHKYAYESVWTSSVTGRLLTSTGHMHDGGVDMTISINGQEVCRSPQAYGGYPGFVEKNGMVHISNTGVCQDFGSVKKGDKIQFRANYDADRYKQDGDIPVMGIALTDMVEE